MEQSEQSEHPSENWRLSDAVRDGWPQIDDAREVLVDSMPDVFYVADRRGRYRDWNDQFNEVLGYTDEEIADLDAMEIIAPADREAMGAKLEAVAAGHEESMEANLLTKDGERLPHELRAAPLTDDDGTVWGLVGTARDISERVAAQNRLRERERRFSTLVSNLPGMVYRCRNEPGWPMSFVSEGCADLTGYDPGAIESGEVSWGEDVLHPDDRERLWDVVQTAIDEGEPFTVTYRITRKDGTERWLWEQGRYVDDEASGTPVLEGFITDITERKRREQDLERYEQLIDTVGDGVFLVDEDRRLVQVNDALTEMVGYDDEELVGRPVSDLVPETNHERWGRLRDELQESDRAVSITESELLRKDGTRVPVEGRFSLLSAEDDHAAIVLVRDISDRKEREQRLEQYKRLIDAVGDGVVVVDEDQRLRRCNDALASLLGYDRDELEGMHMSELVVQDLDEASRQLRTSLREEDTTVVSIEGEAIREDGETVPVEGRYSFLPTENNETTIGLVRDISDRKERGELFERLHRGIRELMDVETVIEVAATAAGVIGQHFDTSATGVRLLRDETLEMVAIETGEERLGERLPAYEVGEGFVGEAYERGDPVVYDDLETLDLEGETGDARSLMLLPIEEYGLISIASREPDAFDETDLELGRLFVADVEAAFERADREEQLYERKRELEKYETLVETIGDGVYMTDEDHRITMANDAAVEMLGLDREALIGREIDEFGDSDREFKERKRQELRNGEAGISRVEQVVEPADGGTIHTENRFSLLPTDGGFRGTVGVVRDITDRKEREDLVRRLHEVLRELMAAETKQAVADRTAAAAERLGFDTVAVRLFDESTDRFEVVARQTNDDRFLGKEMPGYEADEGLVGEVTERGEPIVVDDLSEVDMKYDPSPARSLLLLPIAGHGTISIASTEPGVFDETDLELGRLFAADVESALERADREEQLRERKRDLEKYETLVETMSDGVYMTDENHQITMVNDAMVALIGYDRSTLLGMEITELGEAETARRGREARDRLLEGDESVGQFAGPFETASGETVPVENRFAPLPSEAGFRGTVGVLRDVTRQKEREERLRSQRDELEALNRITELVQETIGALASTATREEIETTVCERLGGSSLYRFAAIGIQPPGDQHLETRAWAGEGYEYLSEVTIPADTEIEGAGPAARAFETGTVTVTHDVESDPLFARFRDAALEHEFRSVAAIPFTYGEVCHGVLAIYADRPAAFSDREIQAFQVLGEMVGFAISATQNRRLIESDGHLELTFSVTAADTCVADLAAETGCPCRLLGSAEATDDGMLHYVSVDGADEDTVMAVARESDVEECRLVRADDEAVVVETHLSESIPSVLVKSGVRPLEVVAEDGEIRIVTEAPRDSDIRTLTDRLGDFGEVTLVSKREVDSWGESSENLREELADRLTDRQQAVLNAAYFGGYFDWPRDSTAEEVAESLDISSATLHQHLRHAQRKLLAAYLDDE